MSVSVNKLKIASRPSRQCVCSNTMLTKICADCDFLFFVAWCFCYELTADIVTYYSIFFVDHPSFICLNVLVPII